MFEINLFLLNIETGNPLTTMEYNFEDVIYVLFVLLKKCVKYVFLNYYYGSFSFLLLTHLTIRTDGSTENGATCMLEIGSLFIT